MTRPSESGGRPGVYLMEVKEAKEKTSRAGDGMLSLKLVAPQYEGVSCYDIIMLEGPGWNIGKAKLSALGIPPDFRGEFNPAMLVGRRVWAFLESEVYDGKTRLKVDIDQGSHCGFQSEKERPDETGPSDPFGEPAPAEERGLTPDETPF